MRTILIVDDDPAIGDLLEEALGGEGYRIRRAYSGSEALLAAERETPDLILLDLMLPGLRGEDVLPRLPAAPVIVLSAKNDPDTRVETLCGGAADFVAKPFDLRELSARIRLRLADAATARTGVLRRGPLTLELTRRAAYANGGELPLTKTEFELLRELSARENAVVTKSELLEELSMRLDTCDEASLKVHISNLRRKLRAAAPEVSLEAVWGIGYLLRV